MDKLGHALKKKQFCWSNYATAINTFAVCSHSPYTIFVFVEWSLLVLCIDV